MGAENRAERFKLVGTGKVNGKCDLGRVRRMIWRESGGIDDEQASGRKVDDSFRGGFLFSVGFQLVWLEIGCVRVLRRLVTKNLTPLYRL